MFQRILVVMENLRVSPRAIAYARELALRMDAEVALLMLADMPFAQGQGLAEKRKSLGRLTEQASRVLSEIGEQYLQAGIATSAVLQVGDQAQELAKFLAKHPPYQVVIWGSDDRLPGGSKKHWIGQAAAVLECPLLTVHSRGDPGGKS